jgi:hypothetical protein
VGCFRPIAQLEGLAGGPSPRTVAHLFNNFSTGVEKFWLLKILMTSHFAARRLTLDAMLCQPILLPTRYGAGAIVDRTSGTGVKASVENRVPRDTTAIAGAAPGKHRRFIDMSPKRNRCAEFAFL